MPFSKKKIRVLVNNKQVNTRNIFIYWIGNEYKLIIILRKLIYLHSNNGQGYKVHFINQDNIKQYLNNIPSYFL